MYNFSPLDRHYDKGFGAVADTFLDSASELKANHHRAKLNGHLPICYLFRHSSELFLKGAIIIVHSSLELPYGEAPHTSEPKIPGADEKDPTKLRSIYRVHDIEVLYIYLRDTLIKERERIDSVTITNWNFSAELTLKFNRLKDIDSSSGYFRYPTERSSNFEKEKSAFKKSSVQDVMELAIKNKEPMKAMKVTTLIGRETEVFIHDDSFTEEAMNLLSDVAGEMSALHFALMNELGQGAFS